MKKLLFGLMILAVCLAVFVACSCGEEKGKITPSESSDTTLPIGAVNTTREQLGAVITTLVSAESTKQPLSTQGVTTPSSTSDGILPIVPITTYAPRDPDATCLDDLDKMAVKPLAFEQPEVFGGNLSLCYVLNDNKNDLQDKLHEALGSGTMYAAVRVNGESYRIAEYEKNGLYFYFNTEKAGALMLKGITYSVSLEFYDTSDKLIYYSRDVVLASPFNTATLPARDPLTISLPTEGLSKEEVDLTGFDVSGFTTWGGSDVSNLFDGNDLSSKYGADAGGVTPAISFRLKESATLTHYTVYTAYDAKKYPERNPIGWRLYGKVGNVWLLLSKVEDTVSHVTGLEALNAKGYSYAISNPRECVEYKIEFTVSGEFQLNEIEFFSTVGYSVPAPDANEGKCLNEIAGVQVAFSSFQLAPELMNQLAAVYYLRSNSTLASSIQNALVTGNAFAALLVQNKLYQIENVVIRNDYLILDLQSAGVPIYTNVSYDISLEIYDAAGTRLYYTQTETKTSDYQNSNLPDRLGMNISLPSDLTAVTVDQRSVRANGMEHFSDGAAVNFFDGDTIGTKIGGYSESGEVEVTFSIRTKKTLLYYTLYTGNDTEFYPDRNPYGWILYGKVGNEYVVLSQVMPEAERDTGIQAENNAPFSYKITNVQACSEYKIVFYTNDTFQMSELVLYTE